VGGKSRKLKGKWGGIKGQITGGQNMVRRRSSTQVDVGEKRRNAGKRKPKNPFIGPQKNRPKRGSGGGGRLEN